MSGLTGKAQIALAAGLWGLWSVCFRSAERMSDGPISARSETFIVFVVMTLLILPVALARRRPLSRRTWILLMAMGVTDAVNALCFFTAMQMTTVAVAVLTHYLQPLIVASCAPFFMRERFRVRTFAALGVALVGLTLLLAPWSAPTGGLTGAMLGALSAVFFAATLILGKILSAETTIVEVSAWPKLSSLLVLALALPPHPFALEAASLGILVIGAVLLGAFPLVIFYRGLAKTPASQAAVLTLCEPLTAVLVGVFIWGEPIDALGVLGAAGVLAGAVLIATAPTDTPNPGSPQKNNGLRP